MKTVLIVDDTKNIRILLTTCLELEGYKVFSAVNGPDALKIFDQEKIDLAFLDIKLPGMSGTEILRHIRNNGIKIPVVIMTAFATIKNAVECTQMGAVAYLQKPFTAVKIKSLLNELFSGGINELIAEPAPAGYNEKIILARKFIDENKAAEALEILKELITVSPEKKEIYLLFSKAHKIAGNFEAARKFEETYNLFNSKFN